MEKRKKRRRRKILLALLLLLFTGVLFSTSAYAWFTANKTVTIDQLDVNVGAESGLQLSVDGVNWKPLITQEDIKKATDTYTTAVNHIPTSSIYPVSTGGVIDPTTGYLNMYRGIVETNDDHYVLTSTKSTETAVANGDFIVFDLFTKITEDADIYLTSASKVLSDNSKGLENAARVAFVYQGSGSTATTAAAAQAFKATADSPIYIWEPNADGHTAAAVKHASDTYGLEDVSTMANVPYNGVVDTFIKDDNVLLNTTPAHETHGSKFKAMEGIVYTPVNNTSNTKFFSLDAGIAKFRVYIWVEGQDVDCENDASGSTVSYNIQLSMENAVAAG